MGVTNWAELETTRDRLTAQLAAITSTSVGGKPNTTGQGQQVDHTNHAESLFRQLEMVNKLLSKKPFVIETEVH